MMYQFILIIVLRPGNRNIPVRRDLDSFDPVPAATIRPALDLDLAFMYDHLLVKREDDGAPISRSAVNPTKQAKNETNETGMF